MSGGLRKSATPLGAWGITRTVWLGAMVAWLVSWGDQLWADYLVFRINVSEQSPGSGTAGAPGVAQPGAPPGGVGVGIGKPLPGGGLGAPGFGPGIPPGGLGIPPGGVPGQPGQPGNNLPQDQATADWFLAVLQGEVRPSATARGMYVFRYDGGQFDFQPTIGVANWAEIHWLPMPSLSQEFDLLTKKKNLATKAPAELALWMLQHWTYHSGSSGFDMLSKFEEQLLAWQKSLDKLPEADRPAIQRLLETRQLLKQDLPENEEVLTRIAPLARGMVRTSGRGPHYTAIHLQQDQKQAEDLLDRMERVFHGLYYWFAYHNRPLPLPRARLVVWLAPSADSFQKLRQSLAETRPLATDGFYSRLEQVLVISPQRLDGAFQRLQSRVGDVDVLLAEISTKVLSQLFGNQPVPAEYTLSLQKLAKPDPAIKKILPLVLQHAAQDPNAAATLSLANILLNSSPAIYQEGIVATITHEGVRQILDVVGYLPARAGFPDSWRDGLLALLETPKSNGEFRAPAFHSGMGNIHWVYLPVYNFFNNEDRVKKGEVVFYEKTPREVTIPVKQVSIRGIIRGENYRDASNAKPEQRELLLLKARAESWALVYFLAQKYPQQLAQFYEDLARLPRDMEVSAEVIEGLFAQQFGLADPKQPDQLDLDKLQQLEEQWRKFMSRQSLPLRLPAYVDAKPANPPNVPGVPGVNPGGNPMP